MNLARGGQIFATRRTPDMWEDISCKEAGCQAFERGWKTVVPTRSDLADAIRSQEFGKRHYTETRAGDLLSEFIFPPGQTCFQRHQKQVLPPTLLHTTQQRVRTLRVDEWIETWNEETYKINREIEKG